MKLQLKTCKKCGERPSFKRKLEKDKEIVFLKCKCGAEGPHVEFNSKKHKDDLEYLEAAELWNKEN
jgi:translation initiation factor 2 beta subunit (eIF-2beta)/eIF-5